MREKKCSNCMLCVEDIKVKFGMDASQLSATVEQLNKKLVEKSLQVSTLEEHVRQGNHLVGQVCTQNYTMLMLKTNEFLKRQDTLKSRYECRLMEMEDRLVLETKKCSEVVKARIAPLQDKIDKMKKSE